jgi:hypothetical protein
MHELEDRIVQGLTGRYLTLLEQAISAKVDEEYRYKRGDFEARSKRFRVAMETLQDSAQAMRDAFLPSSAPQ